MGLFICSLSLGLKNLVFFTSVLYKSTDCIYHVNALAWYQDDQTITHRYSCKKEP